MIKPKLVAEIQQRKKRATAAEAKMQLDTITPNLTALYARLLKLIKKGKLADGPLPPARVLVTLHPFRFAVIDVDDDARADPVAVVDGEAVTAIEDWRRGVAFDLAQLVDSDAAAEARELLQQPSSIFHCRDCGIGGGGMTFDSAHDHGCLKPELTFPFPDADETVLPSSQLVVLDCEAIACAVVDAVGLDPDVARLDDVKDYIFLRDVSKHRRISRDLRSRISSQPHSFADLVRRRDHSRY